MRGALQARFVVQSSTDENQWESFRCRTCQKLLFKLTRHMLEGLSRDQQLEIKCACKTLNYLMGV